MRLGQAYCSSEIICQIEEHVGCHCLWLDKMLRCGFFFTRNWWMKPNFVRWQGALDTTLLNKNCQVLAVVFFGYSDLPPVKLTNTISETLLKVVLNIIPIPYLPKFFLIKPLWELPIVYSLCNLINVIHLFSDSRKVEDLFDEWENPVFTMAPQVFLNKIFSIWSN